LKDGFFDTPTENTAGHDPRVDLKALAGLPADHRRNHPVVAKNVFEARLYR
jgi:hypothetical protein